MLPTTSGIMRIHTKELRYLTDGSALLKMNCVSSEKYKTKTGQQKENTCWIECVSFSKQAEIINQYFNEKDRIFIQGSLKQDNWETQDGQKRSKHTITIDKFDFVESNKGQQTEARAYQEPEVTYNGQSYVPEIDVDEESLPF